MAEFLRQDANEFATGIRSAEMIAYNKGMTPQDVADALTQIAAAIVKGNYGIPDDEIREFISGSVDQALAAMAKSAGESKCLH